MILTTALVCLTANIYYEARGESLTGQHAVAQVTMNRAGRDPKNVCQVVTEPRQFSWTNDKMKQSHGRFFINKKYAPKDRHAWEQARLIASLTLRGMVRDFTKGATFYHTTTVKPRWDRNMNLVAQWGNHLFYKA